MRLHRLSNMANTRENFSIIVELLKNGRYTRFVPSNGDEVHQITGWFRERFEESKEMWDIVEISIEYNIMTNLFDVSYETTRYENYTKFLLADIDDDGNYPLKMRGAEYIIIGSVMKE